MSIRILLAIWSSCRWCCVLPDNSLLHDLLWASYITWHTSSLFGVLPPTIYPWHIWPPPNNCNSESLQHERPAYIRRTIISRSPYLRTQRTSPCSRRCHKHDPIGCTRISSSLRNPRTLRSPQGCLEMPKSDSTVATAADMITKYSASRFWKSQRPRRSHNHLRILCRVPVRVREAFWCQNAWSTLDLGR